MRAGRISVRVGFKNASKRQAEEIFLRMFIDLPTPASLRGMEEATTPAIETEKLPSLPFTLPDDAESARLRGLAADFAAEVPEGDFSPADLQDYLLIHKKNPAKAVESVKEWMEKVYEERRRKDEEQEEQKEFRRAEKRKQRDRFREEVKAAVQGLNSESAAASEDEGKKEKQESEKVGEVETATATGGDDKVEGATESEDKKSEEEKEPST